ncbi:MAG: hypothetical protein K2K57_10075 [Oscillospiraceae bacterium]|nr:hypothetical protein [Oscillospiraceae bacterium]
MNDKDINKGKKADHELIISAHPLPEGSYPLPPEAIAEIMEGTRKTHSKKQKNILEEDDLDDWVERHFLIFPDNELWTESVNYDNSLSYRHKKLSEVFFSVTNEEMKFHKFPVFRAAEKIAIKVMYKIFGAKVTEGTFQTADINWNFCSVCLRNGISHTDIFTQRENVLYHLTVYSPADVTSKVLDEVKEALSTFEFTDQ